MARGYAQIPVGIWENPDFVALPQKAQRLYFFLLSQPGLSHAGHLPVTLRRWARKAGDLTANELIELLDLLAETGFIVLDDETEELLIRTFVRDDGMWKQPRMVSAMVAATAEIESLRLREAFLAEAQQIPLEELSDAPGKDGKPSVQAQIVDALRGLRAALRLPSRPPREPVAEGSQSTGGMPGSPSAGPDEALPKHSRGPDEALTNPSSGDNVRAHARTEPTPTPTPTPEVLAEAEPPSTHAPPPESETEGQRVNRLAKTYTDRKKLSNFQGVAGVVRKAVADGHSDDDITSGLAQLLRENRAVTANALSIAMTGPARSAATVPDANTSDEEIPSDKLKF